MPDQSEPDNALTPIIESLERRLSAAKQLQQLLRNNPELACELERHFAAQTGRGGGAVPLGGNKSSRVSSPTYYDKMVQHFLSTGNQWVTAPELAEAIDAPRNSIGYTMYKSHPDRFESKPAPGHGRKKLWRLKPEVWNNGSGTPPSELHANLNGKEVNHEAYEDHS
jgi:hypothetical protein